MLASTAMRLADLIGQDTARTALLRAIECGHLPAQDAGGAAIAESPGPLLERARPPAADDPVSHAGCPLSAAAGGGAHGAGAAARPRRRARRDRGDAGRRFGGAPVRAGG